MSESRSIARGAIARATSATLGAPNNHPMPPAAIAIASTTNSRRRHADFFPVMPVTHCRADPAKDNHAEKRTEIHPVPAISRFSHVARRAASHSRSIAHATATAARAVQLSMTLVRLPCCPKRESGWSIRGLGSPRNVGIDLYHCKTCNWVLPDTGCNLASEDRRTVE